MFCIFIVASKPLAVPIVQGFLPLANTVSKREKLEV